MKVFGGARPVTPSLRSVETGAVHPGRIPQWASGYVGVPFAEHGRSPHGWDCWGLVWWCFKEHLAVILPSFAADYRDPADAAEIARVMASRMSDWRAIGPGVRPRLGDVALLRVGRWPGHVGLVMDRRRMLHVERNIRTQFEDYDGPMWARRLLGLYRHRALDHA